MLRFRKKYRVAVIGSTGKGNYGHGLDTAFQNVERAEIVAIADDSDSGRQEVAARLQVNNTYSDYRQMLTKEHPDIVCIGPSWLTERVSMVQHAAENGVHIYCEKPFAPTLKHADQMYTACNNAGIKLAMAHQWAAMPPIRTTLRALKENKYGRIQRLYIRPKDDARGGGEELLLHGTHLFDLLIALAGDPQWVFGHLLINDQDVTKSDGTEATHPIGPIAGNSITAVIGFEKGIRGFFDSTSHLSVDKDRTFDHLFGLTIECENKRIQFRSPGDVYFYDAPTVLADIEHLTWNKLWMDDWHFNPEHLPRPLKKQWLHIGNKILANDLIDAIEANRSPISGIEHAMNITEIVQGVYASHFSHERVDLPLHNRSHPLEIQPSTDGVDDGT